MSKKVLAFETCNWLVREFENVIEEPVRGHSTMYYTGVDLRAARVVILVLDEDLHLVAGSYRYADVVRNRMVVDYIGAIRTVREMKEELEKKLGIELVYAVAAIPSGADALDSSVIKNVVQDTGSETIVLPDEPTVANVVLNIRNDVVVDIGGGTADISVLKDGKVIYVTDGPTGETRFSLVMSGAYQLSFEGADAYKRDRENHRELLPVLKPVIEKASAIISRRTEGRDVDGIYLVEGTCCLTRIEEIIGKKTGIPAYRPAGPMFVTPLGIAKNCADACG